MDLNAVLVLALQAYQEAPSSPWPRQQPPPSSQQQQQQQQQSQAPFSSPSSGVNGSGSGSGSGSGLAAAGEHDSHQQQAQQRGAQRVREYRGLSAAQFQHPLDAQNTALLRVLPGLELIARNLMGPAAEQVGAGLLACTAN